MIELPNVTIICLDCYNYGGAVASLQNCIQKVKAARVVFLTDIPIKVEGIEVIKVPTIRSKREYSHFIVKELYKYFDTSHCLIVQHDGSILDPEQWDDNFLDYDYIGSPWIYEHGRNVGNGGFSLRSKGLQNAIAFDSSIDITHPEDQSICIVYGDYLSGKYGVRFAPEELADKFAFELKEPICPTFGYHGKFHKPYQPTVVVRRWAALGDVISVEPILDHFHKQGYRVCLDTLPQFFNLFQQHYFPILHPSQLDGRVPVKNVNLDLSYESKPDQLHLKTYYEFAGIENGEIRNPILHLSFDARSKEYKLFPKYCLIHDDMRGQPYRNIYGIDWDEIAIALKFKGYTVIQIGKGEHKPIEGAIQFNTSTEALLLMTCAGADLFIGGDSGIAHVCSAFRIPSIIFFGSVDPDVIYPIQDNKIYIHNHHGKGVCDTKFCWSNEVGGTSGKECVVNKTKPPCTQYTTIQLLKAINLLCE